MSAQDNNCDTSRKMTDQERSLVMRLLAIAGKEFDLDTVQVYPMSDGGMGSVRFVTERTASRHRKFGQQLSQLHLKDADGVDVIASLDVDTDGELFELDLWKTDFSPTIRLK